MVTVQKPKVIPSAMETVGGRLLRYICISILFVLLVRFPDMMTTSDEEQQQQQSTTSDSATAAAAKADSAGAAGGVSSKMVLDKVAETAESPNDLDNDDNYVCPYQSLSDLTEAELYPRANHRHMITPPRDQTLYLVCCETTAGPWNIVIHPTWAPLGAKRFLDMVQSRYFQRARRTGSNGVPLMRCVHNFLCQFGLAGAISQEYASTFLDDPNWLPEGPNYRENQAGIKRFQAGYFAYAGAGKDSRNNQFIVALVPSGPLAGGSPWEVPWGELVGSHSFETLSKIYTGYGEHGPSQGSLWKDSGLVKVHEQFPQLDHVKSCRVVDQDSGIGTAIEEERITKQSLGYFDQNMVKQ